jgi:hypothetical protein
MMVVTKIETELNNMMSGAMNNMAAKYVSPKIVLSLFNRGQYERIYLCVD